ncbi:alpha/beta fold hydrolase BchO [Jannaschia sp. M317]|uniref:alpha/beta fold hydrolase BchO n=1 Tax=Jannaschia sp. M317 TaxID=2867011 RepID=UPI0021A5340F|nr:alpha/beta fold hydrolase BchO [Jannaschia sp. M317]UWQ18370.1 alpha/beta fold hydrolase [Jannaschia sp. M317]
MTPPVPDDWPFAAHSRIVPARPHQWHVQQIGSGPDVLLLHGAGAATQSWRGLAPLLARRMRVTMVDLPGHGFTRAGPGRRGLDAMAQDVTTLLAELNLTPRAIIGHSAGAALALRLSLDAAVPVPVVSINGAFQMFGGVAAVLFPLMAKALALNPLTVPLFTAGASPARTRRMLAGTGSRLDEDGLRLYHRLISDKGHVAGALAMMANWSLDRLVRDAAGLSAPVLLLAGDKDGTVPPSVSRDMAAQMPDGRLCIEAGLGHLLHEEAPDLAAGAVIAFLEEVGVLPPAP